MTRLTGQRDTGTDAAQLHRAREQRAAELERPGADAVKEQTSKPGQVSDAIQHQPPPAAIEPRVQAEKPTGQATSQLGLLASQGKEPSCQEQLAAIIGDAQKIDGPLAQRLLTELPDFDRADLRHLLGWRPDPDAVIGGEGHHPDEVVPFDSKGVEAMLRHFGNLDDQGQISLWTSDSTFEGDRRLDMSDVDFLLQSDGKIGQGFEQRIKAHIDANDPFAALFAELPELPKPDEP